MQLVIFMFENIIISDVVSVRLTDEKKFNGHVEYRANLISNEIIYRPNGYSTVNFDGKIMHTTPNSIHILPHKNGGKYSVDYDEADYFIDIFFHTTEPFFTQPIVLNNLKSNKLNLLFKKAFSSFIKKEDGYKLDCISILYKILAEIEKKNYIPESKFKKLEPAIKYIEGNFLKKNISCAYLAKICGISYNYLQRLFVEKYGISPKRYIIQLKINYACDLLSMGDYSVTKIAEEAGFSDLYFFSRQFKEYIGVSPKEYQNMIR